jgi:hypothetical protein
MRAQGRARNGAIDLQAGVMGMTWGALRIGGMRGKGIDGNMELPRLYTLQQASELLNLKTATLRKLVYRGDFETIRANPRGKILISDLELRRFIKSHSSSYAARPAKR